MLAEFVESVSDEAESVRQWASPIASERKVRVCDRRRSERRTALGFALQQFERSVGGRAHPNQVISTHRHLTVVLPPQAFHDSKPQLKRRVLRSDDLSEVARAGALAYRELPFQVFGRSRLPQIGQDRGDAVRTRVLVRDL